ncbi:MULTISPECIES: glycine rich domain-containing protein [unclassified Clostridioides]|uniref:glycine rich domain-containing protein n=1 Tax=unclassified Clostridioides TaxID=2635829 RepID=UPI001D0FFF12|nr:hypothetical protein [Clostridioides sp. ES-W-0018-02]MCC0713131.1 hypothetical protein [Clostridioides sp. ES-W-0017-02]
MATVYEFNYTGSEQRVTLKPGKYKLECWGASGGKKGVISGGGARGGYSTGVLTLKKLTTLFIYVGQAGMPDYTLTSIFNGGGLGKQVTGGGGTDIRLTAGAWDNEQGLLSRIIVAGGGGASTLRDGEGGLGGGEIAGNATSTLSYFSPGAGQYDGCRGFNFYCNSYFGRGGTYTADYLYSCNYGGGGGWFGGAGNSLTCGGGGGSGYVLTKNSYKPKGYTPTSEYYLSDIAMTTGGSTIDADGYAKITLLQALPLLTVSSYNSTQAIFKADHTDPALLTKIEVFLDDILKETITTNLASEKTINYTLEDNALHTLKIVVTDNANATAEKVVSISKNIMPLGDDASLQDIATKVSEMKDGLINGKTSIINVLALKNIESSLNNSLVELSEKVKDSFDSSDASVQDLTNKLTQANNTISQLNTQISNLKIAKGIFSMTTRLSSYASDAGFNIYSHSKTQDKAYFIEINNLEFTPDLIILEYKSYDGSNQYTICSFIESPGYSQYYFLEFYSLINSNIRTDEFKRVTKREFGYFKIPICIYQTVIEQQYNLEGNVIKWTALQI